MNALETRASDVVIDSLLNYETVKVDNIANLKFLTMFATLILIWWFVYRFKYCDNDDMEVQRYGLVLQKWGEAIGVTKATLALLNLGSMIDS